METKHTPGPWLVEHDEEYDEVTVYAEIEKYEYNMTICEVSPYITKDGALSGIMDTDQIAANASLIAAAPEMADALIETCETCESSVCGGCSTGRALHKAGITLSHWRGLDVSAPTSEVKK